MRRLNIQLPVSIFKEGKHFIAYAPALDLSTSGNSYEQVRRRFHEIVLIFLEELVKKGAMEEVLHSLGWRQVKKKWSPPVLISQESEKIQLALK